MRGSRFTGRGGVKEQFVEGHRIDNLQASHLIGWSERSRSLLKPPRLRMQLVIALCSMKRKPKSGLPRLFDRPKYRERNIIVRMFGWLKESRWIVTCFDELAISYAEMVWLACAMRYLRHYFSYRA